MKILKLKLKVLSEKLKKCQVAGLKIISSEDISDKIDVTYFIY
jgi:hypothetical protein